MILHLRLPDQCARERVHGVGIGAQIAKKHGKLVGTGERGKTDRGSNTASVLNAQRWSQRQRGSLGHGDSLMKSPGIRYRYYVSLLHLKGESKTASVGSVTGAP